MSDSDHSRRQKIELLCDEFTTNWSPDSADQIHSYLIRVNPKSRRMLLRFLLELDLEFRREAGVSIDPARYAKIDEAALSIVTSLIEQEKEKADDQAGLDATRLHLNEVGTQTIGPYKLLQKIGEGGMGTVWMGEQERPVRRRVALKIIRGDKGSKETVARFEAERQALAMMDHQNIAKILDAGSTDDGSPYFVMELVKGVPITKFCDDNKLSIKERLELLLPVCSAVQHAHQKGIIHRDLKPSNVLVALHDGQPLPKVIDFGLAKALEHTTKLTDKTLFTEFGKVVGTLQYMSPEQAEMSALDVDTRTDIYSLGVLLYELLTGSTPLDRQALGNHALLQLLAIIQEKDPRDRAIELALPERLR